MAFVLLVQCASARGEEPPRPSCTAAGSGSDASCTNAMSEDGSEAVSLLQRKAQLHVKGGLQGPDEQGRAQLVETVLGKAPPVTVNGANASVPSVLSAEQQEELDGWLQKLHAHLEEKGVAVLGANGSAQADRLQMRAVYDSLAQEPWVKTVCETGFNAGDSALRFLVLSDAKVYDFDLGGLNYTKVAAAFLQEHFPGRLHVTWGDSTTMLPKFHKSRPEVKCDLAIVDGGHTHYVALADLKNFHPMVPEKHVLFLDDSPCGSEWCIGVNQAWGEMREAGCVDQTLEHRHDGSYGFRAALYTPCDLPV